MKPQLLTLLLVSKFTIAFNSCYPKLIKLSHVKMNFSVKNLVSLYTLKTHYIL